MPDVDKTIMGLTAFLKCNSMKCDGCEYQDKKPGMPGGCRLDQYQVLEDAIKLLKEQKHGETFTVIDKKTGKEADTYNIALHEDWAKHLCYCDMEGWAIEDDGTLLLVDECGRFEYADRERFKVKWDA